MFDHTLFVIREILWTCTDRRKYIRIYSYYCVTVWRFVKLAQKYDLKSPQVISSMHNIPFAQINLNEIRKRVVQIIVVFPRIHFAKINDNCLKLNAMLTTTMLIIIITTNSMVDFFRISMSSIQNYATNHVYTWSYLISTIFQTYKTTWQTILIT